MTRIKVSFSSLRRTSCPVCAQAYGQSLLVYHVVGAGGLPRRRRLQTAGHEHEGDGADKRHRALRRQGGTAQRAEQTAASRSSSQNRRTIKQLSAARWQQRLTGCPGNIIAYVKKPLGSIKNLVSQKRYTDIRDRRRANSTPWQVAAPQAGLYKFADRFNQFKKQ